MCHFFKVESPFWLKSGGSGAYKLCFFVSLRTTIAKFWMIATNIEVSFWGILALFLVTIHATRSTE